MKIRFAVILLSAAFAVWGQRGGGGGAPGGAGGGVPGGGASGGGFPGSNGGNTSRTPGNMTPSTQTPGIQSPIFLSGKVVMADGSPLPPGIAIQRVCQGSPRTVGYTDSRGNFSFQWGEYSGVTPDASEPGMGLPGGSRGGLSAPTAGGSTVSNSTSTAMMSRGMGSQIGACELRASLPGFTSDSVNLFMHRSMDSPDVGRIVLHRNTAVQGTSVSATSLEAPKDARKAFEKGLQAMHKNNAEEAGKQFGKAVDIYPKYADAWVELGRIRAAAKENAGAREAFTNATKSDPKLVTPYLELGMMAAREQNWRESAEYLDKALQLDPVDFPQGWYVDAVANFNLKTQDPKKLDAAEKSAREAVKLDPQHRNPRADYLLGLVLMEKRDYAAAATELKNYLAMAPSADNHEEVQKQIEQIEKLDPPKQ